eukprot:jgi/Ulvmu1/3763/UM175_0011.1
MPAEDAGPPRTLETGLRSSPCNTLETGSKSSGVHAKADSIWSAGKKLGVATVRKLKLLSTEHPELARQSMLTEQGRKAAVYGTQPCESQLVDANDFGCEPVCPQGQLANRHLADESRQPEPEHRVAGAEAYGDNNTLHTQDAPAPDDASTSAGPPVLPDFLPIIIKSSHNQFASLLEYSAKDGLDQAGIPFTGSCSSHALLSPRKDRTAVATGGAAPGDSPCSHPSQAAPGLNLGDDGTVAAAAYQKHEERPEPAQLTERQAVLKMRAVQELTDAREAVEALEAQAAADERLAQLLDSVSKQTQQDIADLDRDAVVADLDGDPVFECPLLCVHCNKADPDEGQCIGQWSALMCNHWVSTHALVEYILHEAQHHRFHMRCPVCAVERCDRCAQHSTDSEGDGCCYVPEKQIRSLLSPKQLTKVHTLQERRYCMANREAIVQCPHPDCTFFYAVQSPPASDKPSAMTGLPTENSGEEGVELSGGAEEQPRWQEGRDMWCEACQVQYCLHCGDRLGTLVKWHAGKTCAQFLQQSQNAGAVMERLRLEQLANTGHERNRGRTWQRCPNCRLEAWKSDEQCNRVVCKDDCGTKFCFLCGENITKQQYLHFWNPWHPCHQKMWHIPLAGTDGRPACTCGSCRKR